MKLLAAVDPAIDSIFGGITPPDAMNVGGADPTQGLANFIGFGVRVFILIAGIFLLLYLLWGAFDWIVSDGEKEKITKAQNKITNAVIGMLLIFIVLAVFNLLGKSLGIIEPPTDTNTGWFNIKIPSL